MRLDFVLATRALLARCPGAASRILTSDEVGRLSDHFPMEATACLASRPPQPDTESRIGEEGGARRSGEGRSGGRSGGGSNSGCPSRPAYAPLLSEAKRRECRKMSALVNGNDEGGLMIGNWSGNYEPYVAPSKWQGSLAVFEKWVESGPVRWGQCFTFAGCLTTVMRCLGVACRPVSNYWSAHDSGFDRAIDKFFEADGSKSSETEDSIWTFHVRGE